MLTEKHRLYCEALATVADVEAEIDRLNKRFESDMASVVERLNLAKDWCDAKASDVAEEKIAAGSNAIEMPDKTIRLISRARRGRKTPECPEGAQPKYPFVVTRKDVRT